MPFAFLMTEILRRREERDAKENQNSEYINSRQKRELIWLLISLCSIALSFLTTNKALVILLLLAGTFYFGKFFRSCLYK